MTASRPKATQVVVDPSAGITFFPNEALSPSPGAGSFPSRDEAVTAPPVASMQIMCPREAPQGDRAGEEEVTGTNTA